MQKTFREPTAVDGRAVSRRRFLGFGIGAITALIGTALGLPLAGYAVSPAFQKKKLDWIDVGSIGDFKPRQPKKVEYNAFRKDGWIEESVRKSAWAVLQDGNTVVVYDPRCTHLGCAYRWDDAKGVFLCPCHDAIFDIDGKVVAGPPPRPLDRLTSKVEGGKLLVMEG
ncbi:MAG: ubiquinol-cytochrome c reductase iron-sulfur subunit [Chloroflexi bacterium]|nr:ubiquinol-cytochrome c reductase iron-sulfur subunit [Chloroflexota bacterium]